MERREKDLPDGFKEFEFSMSSSDEMARWMKCVPIPQDLPSTHEVRWSWQPDGRGPGKLVVGTYPTATAAPPSTGAATTEPTPGTDSAATVDVHAGARSAVVADLNKLDMPDLQTRAGELGVAYSAKTTKPQLVARIADKLAPEKAE